MTLTPKALPGCAGQLLTNISGSTNRVENIRLAARYFNGTVLMPGETFSYNGIVGSRSAARGFLPAPAYVGAETVQETGGGVSVGLSFPWVPWERPFPALVGRGSVFSSCCRAAQQPSPGGAARKTGSLRQGYG